MSADTDIHLLQLRKTDLKALAQTSRHLHKLVAKTLWHSVTVKPPSEFELQRFPAASLPQTCLQLATQLHFRSEIRHAITKRCPHQQDIDSSLFGFDEKDLDSEYDTDDTGDTDDTDDTDDDHDQPRFDLLSARVESLLVRLEANQLHSFG